MAILTEVQFMHRYFRDGRCRCFSVVPADSSLRDMLCHGLLLKADPGRIRLLYDTKQAARQRSRSDILQKGLVIRCLLQLEDADFYNYTSPLATDITRQALYFCNRPGRSFLHTEEQVSGSDLVETTPPCKNPGRKLVLEPDPQRPFIKPFAILDLRLYPGLEMEYHISFQTRSTWWNYILVGHHLKELRDPAILHPATKLAFTGPATVRLPDSRTGLSFVSPAQLEIKETPVATYTLVENFDPATGKYKVVIPTLPIPDARVLSRTHTRTKQADRSEIFLY